MKKIKSNHIVLGLSLIVLIFLIACNHFDKPALIYDPNLTEGTKDPAITSIVPSDSAIAGIREIIINGQNFSTIPDSNWVYIGGYRSIIKTASASQIVVYRPPIFGDSLVIDITVPGAFGTAHLPKKYKIGNPLIPFNDHDVRYKDQAYPLYAMEVDKSENLYVASSQVILKIPPSNIISNYSNLPSNFLTITDIKFGPGGYLYVVPLEPTGTNNTIYRIDPSGALETSPSYFAKVPKGNAKVLEFDQSGNLYTGDKVGIYIIHSDKSIKASGRYATNYRIYKLRVYNGYIYVAAQYTGTDASIPKMSIWRNLIVSADSLGQNELVVNIRSNPDLSDANTMINSFDIDINGKIYLCLQNSSKPLSYAIYAVESDGSITPFYVEKILPPIVDQIMWGVSKYLYLNRGVKMTGVPDSVRLYKMGMALNGAPYLGR